MLKTSQTPSVERTTVVHTQVSAAQPSGLEDGPIVAEHSHV